MQLITSNAALPLIVGLQLAQTCLLCSAFQTVGSELPLIQIGRQLSFEGGPKPPHCEEQCPQDLPPVCDIHKGPGQVEEYPSDCKGACAGADPVYFIPGKCDDIPCQDQCAFQEWDGAVCDTASSPPETYASKCVALCSGAIEDDLAEGECPTSCEDDCPSDSMPVCDIKGFPDTLVEYASECAAGCAASAEEQVLVPGTCAELEAHPCEMMCADDEGGPVCDISGNLVDFDNRCLAECKPGGGRFLVDGKCEEQPCDVICQFDGSGKVCDEVLRTEYNNECEAECEGAADVTPGACDQTLPSEFVDLSTSPCAQDLSCATQ